MTHKTALLPATRALFGKNKASFEEIASVWAPCTVQVMSRTLRGATALRFVVGSGKGGYDESFEAAHDQTRLPLGTFEEIAAVYIEDEGKTVEVLRGDAEQIPATAPVLVYK